MLSCPGLCRGRLGTCWTLRKRHGGPGRLEWFVRRTGLPGNQFRPVMIHDGQWLLVINVPERALRLVLAEKPKVGEQLAKPDVRGEVAQFSEYG